jgi:hypothetical protein
MRCLAMLLCIVFCFVGIGSAIDMKNNNTKKYQSDEYGISFYYPAVLEVHADNTKGIKIRFPNEGTLFDSDTYVLAEHCDAFPKAFQYTTGAEGGGGFKRVTIKGQTFIKDIHEEHAMGGVHWRAEQYATMRNGICLEVRSDDFNPNPTMAVIKQIIYSLEFTGTQKGGN